MAEKTQLEKEIDELGRLTAREEDLKERKKKLQESIRSHMEWEGQEEVYGRSFRVKYVEESIYPQVDSNAVKAEFGEHWYKFAKWVHRSPSIRCYALKRKRRK